MSILDVNGQEISRDEERTLSGGRFNSGDTKIFRDDHAALLLGATRPDVDYRYGDSVASLDEGDDFVEVAFERSALRRFDLVIGANGLHSQVRKLAFGATNDCLRPLGVDLAIFTTPNVLNLRDWQIVYRDDVSGHVIPTATTANFASVSASE